MTTIVITETPTPADVPTDPTPLPPPPPTPEPVPALSSNVTAALALSNSEARQVLYDESVDAQRYVEPGYWYPVISTKCAPLTRYLDIASASTGQISIPDGVDETYASGVGSRRILAFIRALEDEYGRDFVHTFNQYDVSAALQSGDEDAWASLERVCGSRDEPMWITLYTERPYSTVDAALAWCPANGVPRGECGAWPVLIPGGRAKYYE